MVPAAIIGRITTQASIAEKRSNLLRCATLFQLGDRDAVSKLREVFLLILSTQIGKVGLGKVMNSAIRRHSPFVNLKYRGREFAIISAFSLLVTGCLDGRRIGQPYLVGRRAEGSARRQRRPFAAFRILQFWPWNVGVPKRRRQLRLQQPTVDWSNQFRRSPGLHRGSQAMSFQVGGRYYPDVPAGGPEWGLRTTLTVLFPK